MFWAGLEGVARIIERLDYWHQQTGKDVVQAGAAA